MENSRRPYDRSLPKEPGPKKPRLVEALNAPDRSSNGRSGFIQRSAASNSGGGGSSFQRDRDSESSDSVRGPFPHQPGQQLHQELVTQYKTALAELTFNSKPIITNLTIIAGENLHTAKAIADTVCANILEVPSEQKLPSLYLLDSIVKNIGRDYIKSFAARLPEVFCKAYRQVDPSIHQGMRHLFGTWKGVFPPQSLQMIEKELGFTTTVNGLSPGTMTSKPDSQSQRPAQSIHVNPKYLEARKHLQPTRARGAGSDISGALANSIEDVESLERTSSVNSGRSWTDTYAKHQHRDLVNEPVRDRNTSIPYVDPEYGSNVSERSGFGTGRVSETSKEQGFDRPWYESGSDVTGKISKHGFDRSATHKSSISNSHLQHKKNFTSSNTNGVCRSWKNSEEEEYIWDEMNSRTTDHGAAETLAQDHRTPDNYERLDIDSLLKRPQGVRDIGQRVDDNKASADSISTELGKVTSGDQMPSLWPQDMHPPDGKILGGPGKKIPGYSVGYTSGLGSSASIAAREPFQPQHGQSHIEASSYGPKVSMTQKPQNSGAGSSTTQSFMHQRPPSPSFSASNSNPLLRNISERNQTSIGVPTDPRKPPGLRNMGSHDQLSRDSLPLPSRDVYQTSIQRSQPQNLRTTSAVIPPLKQRKHVSTQQRNLEVSEFDSSGGQNSFLPQISGAESLSSMVNPTSDKSNTRTNNFPGSGQSITSSLLAAVVQSGILDRSSLTGSSTKPNFQEAGPGTSLGDVQPPLSSGPHPAIFSSSQPLHGNTGHLAFSQKKVEHPPLPLGRPPSSLVGHPEQTPSAVKSTSNPVSSLLSSLVAKGLISSSKLDPASSTSMKISDQPQDRGPGVASTSSSPVSSVPVLMTKPLLSNTDEPSSFKSAAKVSDDLPGSTKIKNLIGFEFRPDVVRNLHPDVVRDLSDLPHQCSICGLRLKLQERLDRHMEWHALRDSEQNPCNKTSRRWYADSVDWVAGIGHLDPSDSATHEVSESSEQMVPADESQCACILCGELFEDFYSQERGEWMFKGTVYLTIPSSDSHERTGTMSDNAFLSPIVHSNCISEYSVRDLGLACDIKLENDA